MFKKKRKDENLGQVIIPTNHPSPPVQHEVDAAFILARHYQTVVEFLIPIDDYMRKTADLKMLGVEWEIKCPTGTSRSTISNQLRRASKQSMNIIIDTRHTKLRYNDIEKRVQFGMSSSSSIKKVILIDKSGKVVEFQK